MERRRLDTGELVARTTGAPGAFIGNAIPITYLPDGTLAVADGTQVKLYQPGTDTASATLTFDEPVALLEASPTEQALTVATQTLGPENSGTTYHVDTANGGRTEVTGLSWLAMFAPDGTSFVLAEIDGSLDTVLVRFDARSLTEVGRATDSAPGVGSGAQLTTGEIIMQDIMGEMWLAGPDVSSLQSVRLPRCWPRAARWPSDRSGRRSSGGVPPARPRGSRRRMGDRRPGGDVPPRVPGRHVGALARTDRKQLASVVPNVGRDRFG